MAGSYIKQWLVGLGFDIDQAGLRRFMGALGGLTSEVASLGAELVAVAETVQATVTIIANNMEDLYFASQRTRSSVGDIQAISLAVEQFGGTADGAKGSLEGLAQAVRTNPGIAALINNLLGKGAANRGSEEAMVGLSRKFRKMPYFLAHQYASMLGIDEQTLFAMTQNGFEASIRKNRTMYTANGMNPDAAAKKSHEFMVATRELNAQLTVLGQMFMVAILPAVKAFVGWTSTAIGLVQRLDQATDGWTTALGGLFLAWKAVAAILSWLFPALRLLSFSLIPRLLLQLALLASAVGLPGLGGAFLALGAAIEATPVGWILTAMAAIAAAAYLIYVNFDKIKAAWNDFASGGRKARAENFQQGLQGGHVNLSMSRDQNKRSQQAFQFFRRAGYTAAQAAGLVGNLVHESGLNTNAVGDHGSAAGLAQWHSDRQGTFKRLFGRDLKGSSFLQQLQFVQWELNNTEGRAGQMLRKAKTAADAAMVVDRYYERSAGLSTGARAATARNIELHQKTDIHVHGSGDPHQTATAVAQQQRRVNGDLTRNTATAVR